MKKLLQILFTFGIVGVSGATLVSCGLASTMITTEKSQFNLEDDLVTVDGIKYNEQVFHFETKLDDNQTVAGEELQKLFPNLKIQGIDIDLSVPNKIVITNNDKEKIYQPGRAEIIYTDLANPTLDLDLVLKKTDLGNVDLRENEWENFKKLVKKANPLLDVEQLEHVDYQWNKPFQESVWTVRLKNNNVYKEHSLVEFDFVGQTDLASDLITIDGIKYNEKLFNFETAITENNVKTELAKIFPNLKVDAINVDLTHKNKIIINSNPDVYYYREASFEILFVDQSLNNSKIDFNLVAHQFDLGKIDLQEKDTTEFLAAIKKANPLVDINQIVPKDYDHYRNPVATKWTIGFKENSIYDQNDFVFQFVNKNDLLDDALTKNNNLPNEEVFRFDVAINQDNVRKELANVFPDLEVDAVNVDLSKPNKIVVSANPDVYYYREASFEMIYVDAGSKLPLNLVITNTNLGKIDLQPTDSKQFLAAIKKVNPLVDIDQIVPTEFSRDAAGNIASWTIKPAENSIYSGKPIKFSFITKADLINDLPGYNQQVFKFNQAIGQDNVLNELKTFFPKLKVDAINVDLSEPNKMVVSANPDVYYYRKASFELLYIDAGANKQIDINKIIKSTDLGQIDLQPTDSEQFLAAIKKANPLVDIDQLEPLEFSQGLNHEVSTWTVGFKENSIYSGQPIKFSFMTKIDLINDLPGYDQQVFKFDQAINQGNVLNELKTKFPKLEVSAVKVDLSNSSKIVISANPDVYYYREASFELLYVDAGNNKQIDLNKVIKSTDLGQIDLQSTDSEKFLAAIKKANPLVDIDQIVPTEFSHDATGNLASWTVKPAENSIYSGKPVKFSFMTKTDLINDLPGYDQQVFKFNQPIGQDNVRNELANVFPDLKANAINVDLSKPNKMVVSANPDVYYYRKASFELLYVDAGANKQIDINKIIKSTDLGQIDLQPIDSEQFLAAIKKANPLVDIDQLEPLEFSQGLNHEVSTWTVGFKENSIYKGETTLKFSFFTKNNLADDLMNHDGIKYNDQVFKFNVALNDDNVKGELTKLFPNLKVDDVNVAFTEKNVLTISAKNDVYGYRSGSYNLLYVDTDENKQIDINKIIKSTDLGQIDLQPTDSEQFLAAIKKANPLVDIDQLEPLEFSQGLNHEVSTWTVGFKENSIYKGESTLKFSFFTKNNLADDLMNHDGIKYNDQVFKFNVALNDDNVKGELTKLFPNLKVDDVNVAFTEKNVLTISAKNDVYGYRSGSYNLLYVDTDENKQIDINKIIKSTDLGQIDLQPTDSEQFLAAIKKANPLVDIDQLEPLEFSQGLNHEVSTWTVGFKENSIYKGESTLKFSFFTKNNLADDLMNHDGIKYNDQVFKFNVALNDDNVKGELTKLFPNLKVDDVNVAFTEKNVLTISAKNDVYGYRSGSYNLLYVDTDENKQIDINKIIKSTDLGQIDLQPTDSEQFLAAIKKANPLVDIDQLEPLEFSQGLNHEVSTWTVGFKENSIYKGESTLKFSFFTKNNLADDLMADGIQYNEQVFKFNVALNGDNVKGELTKLFPNLKVDDVNVAFTEKNVLTISAKNDVYGYRSGSYELLYVDIDQNKQIDISKIIKSTDLGEIPVTNGDPGQFFKTLKKIYPLLDINQLENFGYVKGTGNEPSKWTFMLLSNGLYTPEGKAIVFTFSEIE